MVHFFNAYSFDLGYIQGPSYPMEITKTAAIFGVLNVLLRLSLGVPSFSSTVRKTLQWELMPIAPIFVIYYKYSLLGGNLVPLQRQENFWTPKSVPQNGSIERLFSSSISPNYWKLLGVKICSKTYFSMPMALIWSIVMAHGVLYLLQEPLS